MLPNDSGSAPEGNERQSNGGGNDHLGGRGPTSLKGHTVPGYDFRNLYLIVERLGFSGAGVCMPPARVLDKAGRHVEGDHVFSRSVTSRVPGSEIRIPTAEELRLPSDIGPKRQLDEVIDFVSQSGPLIKRRPSREIRCLITN